MERLEVKGEGLGVGGERLGSDYGDGLFDG